MRQVLTFATICSFQQLLAIIGTLKSQLIITEHKVRMEVVQEMREQIETIENMYRFVL